MINNDATISQFKILADELNFSTPTTRSKIYSAIAQITGEIDSREVTITCFDRSLSQDDLRVFAKIDISCQLPPDTTFILYREKMFDKLFVSLGMQDLQFGEKRFDDNFIIKSNNEQFARSLLDDKIRQQLVRDMFLINGFRFGPKLRKIDWSKLPFMKRKSADDLEDVLDFPTESLEDNQAGDKKIVSSTPKKYLRTEFIHNMENEMKRKWMHRTLKTSIQFIDQVELISKKMNLY